MLENNLPLKRSHPLFDTFILLLTVFIVGLCTIFYELLIGGVSSYFMGDSVKQFSITIGLTMSAMGIGTFISRYIRKKILLYFILVEILLGVAGGLSVPLLFWTYALTDLYYPVMVLLIILVGTLIGMEVPLLARVMAEYFPLHQNISNVLSLDYLGALVAALLFPFVILPFLGLFKASLFTGLANVAIGSFNLWFFRDRLGLTGYKKLFFIILLGGGLLLGLIIAERKLTYAWENTIYQDRVLFSEQSSYQKIVLTKKNEDVRLYLDGHLQFSSVDEYRYHEPITHIPMGWVYNRENILILGGGDGLVAKELLKYADVKQITIVDLDPAVTRLAREDPNLAKINQNSLKHPKVQIVNADAFQFLENSVGFFDIIIADLPDPKNFSLSKLYTKTFYSLIARRLSRQGIFVTQATSPYFAKEAFWSIETTLAKSFAFTYPYHTYLPSFGVWGFIIGSAIKRDVKNIHVLEDTRYLETEHVPQMFIFPKDLQQINVLPNTLNEPRLMDYYLSGWEKWQ